MNIIKLLFSGAIENNEVDSLEVRVFKASFNVLVDLSRDLSEENKTLLSAYERTLKSGEIKDEHMGAM